jgi:hypothetical protein
VVPALNNFKSYSEKNGAKVFLIFPCFFDARYKVNEKKIRFLFDTLKKELKIPMLSTPSEYIFPEGYFYLSSYHLGAKGRQINTKKIIEDLKKEIKITDTKNNHGV